MASPPVIPATIRVSSLPPPICPDSTEITKRPVLSTLITAGSVYLFRMQEAILLTQMPSAPIKTIALKSEKCSFINPLYEVIVSHPSASPLRYMADSANSLLIFLAMGRLDSEIKMIAV